MRALRGRSGVILGHSARAAGLAFATLVLILDQLIKWAMLFPIGLPDRESIELLPIFRLIFVANQGVSMGFLTADGQVARWLLTALTAAIAVGVAVWLWRETSRVDALALGAILGGALGNIADRVRFGYVVDFLNLHFGAWSPFLVFNVGDAGISLGIVILVMRALFPRRRPSEEA